MTIVQQAYNNNASSIYQARSERYVHDVLAAPMHPWQMNLGWNLGGVARGFAIGAGLLALAIPLTGVPVEQPLVLLLAMLLALIGFGALGTIVGIYAEQWDHTTFISNIVILPLAFVGGVFYSVDMLGSPWEELSHFNPLFYLVQAMRFGMLGESDVSVALSLGVTAAVAIPAYLFSQLPVHERAETEGVSEGENRVGQYARRVGEILGLEDETLEMLELAGSLHDVGKQMISERIIDKPGPLTDAEWEAMRKHPELGEAYAREEGHPEDVGSWVRHHHERLDGTGYPDHLEGEEIPMGARIIAVLDAYVGMTSPRAVPAADPAGGRARRARARRGQALRPAGGRHLRAPGAGEPLKLEELERRITTCRRCPRLVEWRERVAREKRAAYAGEDYWGRPVPGFGDPDARVYVLGLAPAAHGGNRTGRVFTGDRSGDWLFASLHRTGFANQPTSLHADDGLELRGAFVAAAVRCAPPANRPLPAERDNCLPYAAQELELMPSVRVIVCLGGFAWDAALRLDPPPPPRPKFGHMAEYELPSGRYLLGSYHPSQQNTFTGRLTEEMTDAVFERASELAIR